MRQKKLDNYKPYLEEKRQYNGKKKPDELKRWLKDITICCLIDHGSHSVM